MSKEDQIEIVHIRKAKEAIYPLTDINVTFAYS